MLTLFKENIEATASVDTTAWLKRQWRAGLDKSKILSAQDLDYLWQSEFSDHLAPDFAHWCQRMNLTWLTPFVTEDLREIFLHGPQLCEALGDERKTIPCNLTEDEWELWIETLAARVRMDFNFTHACRSHCLDWSDQSWRVTLLHASIGEGKTHKAFLRKLSARPKSLASFALDDTGEELLKVLVQNHENILVAGATGSGKTTFLSTLIAEVEDDEHLVLLEDTRELCAKQPRLTRLISQLTPGRSLTDYLAHALRLSPDRIVVGEMRSHEVVPFLLAMNTGHKGLMSTLHSSSAMDAILRVAQLFVLASAQKELSYQEVLRLVSRNVGYVVFLEKRRVKEIIRVFGSDGDQVLYDVIWEAL